MHSVRSAVIRPATPEERQSYWASQTFFGRIVSGAWSRLVGIKNFVSLVKTRDMSAILQAAVPDDPYFAETSLYTVRKRKVCGFELPVPHFMQLYVTASKAILEAVFKHPRQGDKEQHPFFLDSTAASFGTFVNELFTNEGATPENFILSSSATRAKELRNFMLHFLGTGVLAERKNEIVDIAEHAANGLQGTIDARKFAKNYVTNVLTGLFFGGNSDSETMQKAVDIFSQHLMGKMMGKGPSDDDLQWAKRAFASEVEEAIRRGVPHNVAYAMKHGDKQFSNADIQLMAWTFFFGAVDNSSESLTWALLQLALDQSAQTALRNDFDDHIEPFLARSLESFPPVHGAGRMIHSGQDAVAELTLENGDQIDRYLEGGKIIALRLKEMPFGGGFHACPGKKLALDEMTELLRCLVSQYHITTPLKKAPPAIGTALNKINGDVFITIERL
jgi:cytochrome P450